MRRLLCLGILALVASGCADNSDLFALNGGGGSAPTSGSGHGGAESTTHSAGGAGQGGIDSTATSGGNTTSAGGNASTGQGDASTGNGGNASTGQGDASTGNGGNASTGNGGNASTGQGGNASTGNGGNASTGNGGNASTGQGGNASTGNGGNTSSGQGGNMSSGASGGGGGGAPDCAALLAQVNQTLADAQKCKVVGGINDPPCKDNEQGLCCPVVVAFGDSPETQDYLDALMAFFQAGCVPMCPDPACDQDPTGHCQGNGTISNNGVCVPN